MARLKPNTLRRRTEEMTDMADNFNEIFKLGSELEDIGNLIKRMAFHMHNLQEKVDTQAEELRRQQAVDAVEVVRCKDCRYCDPANRHCDHYLGTALPLARKADDFCSYGEKMDGEKE